MCIPRLDLITSAFEVFASGTNSTSSLRGTLILASASGIFNRSSPRSFMTREFIQGYFAYESEQGGSSVAQKAGEGLYCILEPQTAATTGKRTKCTS